MDVLVGAGGVLAGVEEAATVVSPTQFVMLGSPGGTPRSVKKRFVSVCSVLG